LFNSNYKLLLALAEACALLSALLVIFDGENRQKTTTEIGALYVADTETAAVGDFVVLKRRL